MEYKKKALISVNQIGFMWFIMDDIDLLKSMGFTVTVTADNSFDEVHTVAEIERRGAKFVDMRFDSTKALTKNNWSCYKNFKKLINENKFDAIICHTPIIGMLVRMAARGLRCKGTKVIYMTHGFSWTNLSAFKTRLKFSFIEDVGSRFCDAIITINNDDKDIAQKFHCKEVFLVNGVGCNIAKYGECRTDRWAKRHEIGVNDDETMVLAIGKISTLKNHKVIIEAINRLPEKEKYCFVICGREFGGDSVTTELTSLAKQYNIKLKMLGFRRDINELVHCADIGVIPSTREGLGMAGVQQMCAGVPMVGTAVQGIKEYIVPDETGYLVDSPYDVEGFAAGLFQLTDKGVRDKMRSNCLEVAKKFSLENSISQRRNIYSQVFGLR